MIDRFLSRNLWFIYVAFWMAISAIQFVLLYNTFTFSTWLSVTDSLVFNSVFALLGSGLWFMVQYSGRQQKNLFGMLRYHLAGVTFVTLLWLGLSSLIMRTIAASDSVYLEFLTKSVTFRILAGVLLYFLQITVFYLLINIKELKERMEREASLTTMLREAELNKLRAQIKPHFLFNSLNSVSALTLTDPMKAQEMVIKISELMRYSLSMGDEAMSTLKNELYHAGLYLDIEKVRFSDRLLVKEDINPECEDWPVPAMILQPLLENAVKHGVYNMSGPSSIHLIVKCDQEYLNVFIDNNFDVDSSPRKGTGTGLQNVKSRLAAIYSRHDLLSITKKEDSFAVLLKIPRKS